ncbi:MAG: hypothetical protein SGJ19_15810 [Planctomycetia bacterium]|nr:hypothetical protein [Planctomycetia bacterium]
MLLSYVIENTPLRYFDWIGSASLQWVMVVGILALVVVAASFLIGTILNGPWRTERVMYGVLRDAAGDLFRISPRRVGALARLAIQESLSRWVLVALAVFVVAVMFLSWFMRDRAVTAYIDYLMFITAVLVIAVCCFLSAFSLPTDIAQRTIYTIVTKPVRASEIILGRIIGFSTVGTTLLVVASLIGYVFAVRAVTHGHSIDPTAVTTLTDQRDGAVIGYEGTIRDDSGHSHYFSLDKEGHGATSVERGHYHEITLLPGEGDAPATYAVTGPLGVFQARVPIIGDLKFTTREGGEGGGVNVGDEWEYRKFIEGATQAKAIYTFSGLRPELFPEDQYPLGVPIELNLGVFRSYKGDITRGILGSLQVHRPGNLEAKAEEQFFTAKEFVSDRKYIPRKWTTADGKEMELFRDIVRDGQIVVELSCEEPAQYFGVGRNDVYLLAGEQPFLWNYAKGCLGIWFQMVLATTVGVMWSTIVNTAVSLLSTIGCLVLGFFTDMLVNIATGQNLGGGVFESMIRIAKQENLTQQLDATVSTEVVKSADHVANRFLRVVSYILPDFSQFYNVGAVANGYDIGGDAMLMQLTAAVAYFVPIAVAGYFFLKLRELAK